MNGNDGGGGGVARCWVCVWRLLTAFSLTQQAWVLLQQKPFTSLAANPRLGVWNAGVAPVPGAAATSTHTETSSCSITHFHSRLFQRRSCCHPFLVCCYSAVTRHPSFVNSSAQKRSAASDQNLQPHVLQKLHLADVV